MTLRSGTLLVLLGVVAVLLPVAVVTGWSRAPGPRATRAATRVVAVVAAQAAAVLFVAAALNDYAYFFGSWSDLFGTTTHVAPAAPLVRPLPRRAPTPTLTLRHVGAPERAHRVLEMVASGRHHPVSPRRLPGVTFTNWSVPSEWAARGAVAHVGLHGGGPGAPTGADVYLPPAYFDAARGRHRLPLAEVFADAGMPADDLVYRLPMPGYLHYRIARHDASPFVLVLLDGGAVHDGARCLDTPHAARLRWLARDVPREVASALHIAPRSLATVGVGTGGYCAVRVALAAPRRFREAVSLLGCYQPVVGPALGRRPPSAAPGLDAERLGSLLSARRPAVRLLLAPGLARRGPCAAAAAARAVARVRAPTSADVLGGYRHVRRGVIWRVLLPRLFEWLSRHTLPPAAAT